MVDAEHQAARMATVRRVHVPTVNVRLATARTVSARQDIVPMVSAERVTVLEPDLRHARTETVESMA